MSKKQLRIGLIGYSFMGRAHSNAFRQAARFFDLPYEPVLKAVSARNQERLKTFADTWGYQSIESDWRAMVERKDIDLIDIAAPNDMHADIAIAAAQSVKANKPLISPAVDPIRRNICGPIRLAINPPAACIANNWP